MRFVAAVLVLALAVGGIALFVKRAPHDPSGAATGGAHNHSETGHAHSHGHDEHSKAPERGTISLDIYSDGHRAHLLIGSGTPAKLGYSFTDDGVTWSSVVSVSSGFPVPFGMRRGNDARICAYNNQRIAIWSEKGTGWGGGGPFVTVLSEDGGKTWTRGPNPADDGSTSGHAFAAIAADPEGTFHLAWLDSRNKRQGLRYANSRDFGKTWSANVTIDDETCECCWNTLAAPTANDVAVLYRDKNPRDMQLARSTDSGKSWRSAAAGTFNWQFQGCPEVGAGLCGIKSQSGISYRSLVWTGENSSRGLYLLSSLTADTAIKLGPPSASRPDMVAHASGTVAAVYSAMIGEQLSVFGCKSSDGGKTWSAPVVLSAEGVFANYPRVAPVQNGFIVVWTESRGNADTVWNWKSF